MRGGGSFASLEDDIKGGLRMTRGRLGEWRVTPYRVRGRLPLTGVVWLWYGCGPAQPPVHHGYRIGVRHDEIVWVPPWSPIGVGEDEVRGCGTTPCQCTGQAALGGRALKQPRGFPGVAPFCSVSADPRFYTRLEPWDVFGGKRGSSVSLRTVRQQRRGGGNYPAYTWWLNHGRRRFSALHPQPRLNGVR